jgi:hypothetical protein
LKKAGIILALVAVFALVSTASAIHFTDCDTGNRIVVTYVNSSADYDNIFGIVDPVNGDTDLGMIHSVSDGTKYYPVSAYAPGSDIIVYIRTPDLHTYRSWTPAGDGVPSPYHTKVHEESDGSWIVGFEDVWGGGDLDYNDVFLRVACEADPTPLLTPLPTLTTAPLLTPAQPETPIPTPEFPTVALPAAFIIGLLGAVLFIKNSKNN